MAEQFINDGKADRCTQGESDRIHTYIASSKMEVGPRDREKNGKLQNLKDGIQKEHGKLPMQPPADHVKHNNPLEYMRSDP
jgi:hypothetical protein